MDFRISRSSVDGMDDAGLFWALIEPVWPDEAVADELRHIAMATPGQRALYVTTLFIREVDNGGLEQFFHNSSGMYAESVCDAFRLLGANEYASVFERALSIFPSGQVPLRQSYRIRVLESIPKQTRMELFKSLEEQLLGEDRLWPFFRNYVAAHPAEFFID